MTEMSAAEAAIVARFDAAEPAPESWHVQRVARERAAEAWDEGYDAGYLHVPPHHAVNPYRADDLAAPC